MCEDKGTLARLLTTAVAVVPAAGSVEAAAPSATNIVARQLADGTGRVSIAYSLADPDSATVYISVAISTNGESTYSARSYVTGDVGSVRPGSGRQIVWDAKADLGASAAFTSCRAKITAEDSSGNVHPGEMVYIPAGSFPMGNNGLEPYSYSNELPQHSVYLSGYYIGKYEVTRGEYRAFMNAGGYSNSAYWSTAGWSWKGSRMMPVYWPANQDWYGGQPFVQTDNHPVVGVGYYEAEAFCNWAGGHLPTEAQWELAARWTGSQPNVYPWGDVWDVEKCNNWGDSLYAGYQTSPVGSFPSGASPYGCHDMAGNVSEWCEDWYGSSYYAQSPTDDPQGPTSGSYRVLRGGSWALGGYDYARGYYPGSRPRCAYRIRFHGPDNYSNYVGFRLAR